MYALYKKIRNSWVSSILFACVLLVIFLVLFYLSNLNLGPSHKIQSVDQNSVAIDPGAGIKEKLGALDVSMESYDEWAKSEGLNSNSNNNALDADPDGDGLPNYLEYAYGTNPTKADTDGDGFSDSHEIQNGYDPDASNPSARAQVEISVSKINIAAPVIWSNTTDSAGMDKDLENGVIHYYQTAAPGQNGTMIVSGHSSNYVWAKGDYNHIFADLNNVAVGDVITVKETEANGRVLTYSYKISGKKIVSADDQSVFDNSSNPTLELTTCWPIGTNLQRLIVTADLAQ
ncbi:MAG: sortase [Candidatus Pacebacteria bacterium]|nr:sortase [Candidatus Paceibacterota bacterium]MDR3583320.1 sortase [Candidatus Paceibacterota bacterium]